MKDWQGTLLTGHTGATLLKRLAEKAQAQSVQRAEKATGRSFGQYSPWMSHAIKRSAWHHLHLETREPAIPSDSHLKILSEAFNDDGPLRAVDPTNNDREINHDHELAIQDFRLKVSTYLSDIHSLSSDYQSRLLCLVQEVIPLRKISSKIAVRFDGEGMTTQCYRGGVFLTLAHESNRHHCENLLNLIHEVGHQSFNLLLCSDQIVSGDIYTPAYSPVRKTMRPGILAVHALVAVAYMVELMSRAPELFLKNSDPQWVSTRYDGLLKDLEFGLATVKSVPLTPIGKQVVAEFESLHQFARRESNAFRAC